MAGLSLTGAFRLKPGAIVSFVGGGGKTTSMFRLAAELGSAGLRVVTTTTTHIAESQVFFSPAFVRPDNLDRLEEKLNLFNNCLVVGPPDGKGRVQGVPKELIAELHSRSDIDVIIVEADGSRSRPFKAPGDHEPVVSELTTILVPVVGLNSIGLPLSEDCVHRAEIIASISREKLGNPITTDTVSRVLQHPMGGAKNCPAGARLVPLLNKADVHDGMRNAGRIAASLLRNPVVDSVVISAMNEDPAVREVWTHAAGCKAPS